MTLHPADYQLFETMLKRESGLSITPDKTYLLEARLGPVADRFNVNGLEGLAQLLRQGGAEPLRAVVEAMATSETSFFRDGTPFERLKRDILPSLISARAAAKRLRIWSAACASGQEPYSIAMLLHDLPLNGWQCEIVATDMSSEILEKATAGCYTQFEVQRGLPVQMLVRHFEQQNGQWRVKQALRDRVQFRPFNLLDNARGLGVFDIIFCRNVLIYFDAPTKTQVLHNIAGALSPDGVLFLGGAETVLGLTDRLQPVDGMQGV